MPASLHLLTERPRTGVLRLTINDPERRNPLSKSLFQDLEAEVRSLPADVRVVVLTGAGEEVFASGADLTELGQAQGEGLGGGFGEAMESAQAAIEECPAPVVARIQGHCLGAGYQLALACDLRLAQEGIKLGMPPAKLGLVYSHTGLRRFLDAIGAARTRELFLLGRYIDASTALAWGLVNRVAPAEELDPVALELAGELADNAPLAQKGNKRVIAALLSAEGELQAEVEEELIELRRASFASQDMREGMRAFAEKRRARWRGE